jgi:N-acetylglucosaminyldiphosphoundecaprenol N-acetyl-beta-D-mannosaminyltransferase
MDATTLTPVPTLSEVQIGSLPVNPLTFDASAAWVMKYLENRHRLPTGTIVTPNAQHVTLAEKNRLFQEACRAAVLSVPDGASIVLASRVLGTPVPHRVAGCDLMERLCADCAKRGFSVYFLGGLPAAAEKAALQLQNRHPGLKVSGVYCPPYEFESDPAECVGIRRRLSAAAPDLLFVAFGAPKQEIWAWQGCADLPIGMVMSVGSSFDTYAGMRRRAPLWMQHSGLEWLFRLIVEPRRLWRRYLIGNAVFLYIVSQQWLRQRRHKPHRNEPGSRLTESERVMEEILETTLVRDKQRKAG